MSTGKYEETLVAVAGLYDALKTIEVAMELRGQTGRLRNLLSAQDLDEITANCVKAVRLHNKNLEESLG